MSSTATARPALSPLFSSSSLTIPKARTSRSIRPSTAPNLRTQSDFTPVSSPKDKCSSPGPSFSHLVCPGAPKRAFLDLEDEPSPSASSLAGSPLQPSHNDDNDDEDEDSPLSVYEFIARSPCVNFTVPLPEPIPSPELHAGSYDHLPFEFDFEAATSSSHTERIQPPTFGSLGLTFDQQSSVLQLDLGLGEQSSSSGAGFERSLLAGNAWRSEEPSTLRVDASEASAWWSSFQPTPELSVSPTETESDELDPFFSEFSTPPSNQRGVRTLPSVCSHASSPRRPETLDDDMPWHDLPSTCGFVSSKHSMVASSVSAPPAIPVNGAITLAAFLAENPGPSPPSFMDANKQDFNRYMQPAVASTRVRRASEGDCLIDDAERSRNASVLAILSKARTALRRVRA